ncbi:hypothetical protein KP509_16G083200 [Ceratopteris richardii]|uniref:Uncharacterized protein n=1 Tax=Ceratopteris richardii TaxID=49495 RepID=A0A8T2T225_CERRI|nr:hypothetical protein KP509_16G083200 [Ceratopteris richardii]
MIRPPYTYMCCFLWWLSILLVHRTWSTRPVVCIRIHCIRFRHCLPMAW